MLPPPPEETLNALGNDHEIIVAVCDHFYNHSKNSQLPYMVCLPLKDYEVHKNQLHDIHIYLWDSFLV